MSGACGSPAGDSGDSPSTVLVSGMDLSWQSYPTEPSSPWPRHQCFSDLSKQLFWICEDEPEALQEILGTVEAHGIVDCRGYPAGPRTTY